jgi:hypothetical protein
VLVAFLLLAQTLSVTHQLDFAAHDNGQTCTVCVSLTQLGHSAVGSPPEFAFEAATPSFVVSIVPDFVSNVLSRRYARGPPAVSFTF